MFEFISEANRKTTGVLHIPVRKTMRSAGYDFFIPESYDGTVIKPGEQLLVWSDIKCRLAIQHYLALHVRSSAGVKHGIILANGTGIIDSDYYNNIDNEGNIGLPLKNTSDKPFTLVGGDSIAQGIISPFVVDLDEMQPGDKRTGGFGSTGR